MNERERAEREGGRQREAEACLPLRYAVNNKRL